MMLDPSMIMGAIDADARRLDELEKAIETATGLLDEAEQQWLEIYDKVAESLKDEMVEQDRKGDPAEHTITSVARRQDRVAFTNLRRAKRAVDRLKEQIPAKRSAMSGRQSQLRALSEEASFPAQGQDVRGPATFAARRAQEQGLGRAA